MSFDFDYINEIVSLFQIINDTQADKIKKVTEMFVKNIKEDKLIHFFGNGHSQIVGIENFSRAGGLGNVNVILDSTITFGDGAQRAASLEHLPGLADIVYDQYKIEHGDILIITSNSGRNAMPVEMALRAKKESVFTIAITNLEQSKNTTSRHSSNKKLYEIADLVIDTCIPVGDSLMEIGGVKTAPATTLVSVLIVNTIVNETLKVLAKEGIPLPIFKSQNIDGNDNNKLYAKYDGRIKHF